MESPLLDCRRRPGRRATPSPLDPALRQPGVAFLARPYAPRQDGLDLRRAKERLHRFFACLSEHIFW